MIRLGIDICRALEYCQKMNVIHRDIKPENIFISANGDYKLGDFGIARTVEKTTSGLSRKAALMFIWLLRYTKVRNMVQVWIFILWALYCIVSAESKRTPFSPDFPAPITHSDRESAIARRIGGQPIPMPCGGKRCAGRNHHKSLCVCGKRIGITHRKRCGALWSRPWRLLLIPRFMRDKRNAAGSDGQKRCGCIRRAETEVPHWGYGKWSGRDRKQNLSMEHGTKTEEKHRKMY